MKRTIIALLAIALFSMAGCDQPEPDRVLQREIFFECLKNVPKGPDHVKYNDWDDVVDSCRVAAYNMSLKKPSEKSMEDK